MGFDSSTGHNEYKQRFCGEWNDNFMFLTLKSSNPVTNFIINHLVVLFIVLNEYSYYANNVSSLIMKPLAIISRNKIVTVA
jgi:hypothetical protein